MPKFAGSRRQRVSDLRSPCPKRSQNCAGQLRMSRESIPNHPVALVPCALAPPLRSSVAENSKIPNPRSLFFLLLCFHTGPCSGSTASPGPPLPQSHASLMSPVSPRRPSPILPDWPSTVAREVHNCDDCQRRPREGRDGDNAHLELWRPQHRRCCGCGSGLSLPLFGACHPTSAVAQPPRELDRGNSTHFSTITFRNLQPAHHRGKPSTLRAVTQPTESWSRPCCSP
ncbi:hypothetical protein BT67DRAFT_34362 [Trichocladium antarcticum]|uniref:Uncharacterized protein n=1 Tax=Trichocladium antarcticum TaxID=1450529 RepID=A0AAN6ZD48_9PEZI|nr:hypothetical protein BT67DRAFT_34362 [Trichocladium antarcticum]